MFYNKLLYFLEFGVVVIPFVGYFRKKKVQIFELRHIYK